MNDLNTNKSKKIIIGVSIVFSTIILIIGFTSAYFTQSSIGDVENVVTTDINGTLGFNDNNVYMFGNFIPVEENDVLGFASKTNRCNYQDDMYACNMYEFTVTNNSNVTQELKITLNTIENGFANLHYNLLESSIEKLTIDNNYLTSKVHIDGTGEKEMLNNIILTPGSHKTYTIIYYIKNLNIDQTTVDANKKFYARVRVDSITTGTYAETLMEAENCYNYELINDTTENRELYGDLFASVVGTYKITEFYGIKEGGDVDTSCGVTKKGEYYSVTIPSKLKDENDEEMEVTTLGNSLFVGAEVEFVEGQDAPNIKLNNYSKITSIELEEGIKVIENGEGLGTFAGIGNESYDEVNQSFIHYDKVTVVIPSTLTIIGNNSFSSSGIKEIIFNKDSEGKSSLKTIGDIAFNSANLYSIAIPSNVETIGRLSFASNPNLTYLTFEGAEDGTSKLTTIGESAFNKSNITSNQQNPLIIPYSVKMIKEAAFGYNPKLTKLTFAGDIYNYYEDENNYNLLEIGSEAFYNTGLSYSDQEELVLPARIRSIGNSGFSGTEDGTIKDTLKNIKYMGNRTTMNTFGANWYPSGATVNVYIED